MKLKLLIFIILIFPGFVLKGQFFDPLFQPTNLDFEDGKPGGMPVGWILPSYAAKANYSAQLVDINPVDGKYCLELRSNGEYKDGVYGSIMQSIDALPYRGRRIRIRAAVRTEITSKAGSAHLWLREHLINNQQGQFVRMEDDPIVFSTWDYYQIEADISQYAKVINFGLLMFGTGKSYIDDVTVELADTDSSAWKTPKPLTQNGLKNLMSFSDVLGYVSFFYPSFEAQFTNWEDFTLAGVEKIEGSKDKNELVSNMNSLFKPIAPEIEFYSDTISLRKYVPKKYPGELPKVELAWIQKLTDISRDDIKPEKSRVINIYNSLRKSSGTVLQIVRAEGFRGKKVKLSAYIKTELIGPAGNAQLWIRADDPDDKPVLRKAMWDNPATSKNWKKYSVEAVIPSNAEFVRIGLILIGEGKAWFDDISFTSDNSKAEIGNAGFETGNAGKIPKLWIFPKNSLWSGYNALVSDKQPYKGKQCLEISSDINTMIRVPEPDSYVSKNLISGICFTLPITVKTDSALTLPAPDTLKYPPVKWNKPKGFVLSGKDRSSRLTAVITAYNYLKHFSLKKIDDKVLTDALEEALDKAAVDDTEEKFLKTLEKFTAITNDSRLRVWQQDKQIRYGLPFLWKKAGKSIVITYVADNISDIKKGDIVLAINGMKASEILKNEMQYISGATEGWKTIRALAELRAGEKNTKTRLTLERNGKQVNVEIKQNVLLSKLAEQRPPKVYLIDSDYFYIDLTRTGERDIIDTVDALSSAKGIIFDLRGLTNESVNLLGFFIDRAIKSVTWKIPVYTKPDHKLISYKKISGKIEPNKKHIDAKVIFLCDERTIGYSEAILQIARYYKIGKIIGRETAGSCGDIIPVMLPAGYSYSMTAVEVDGPDGSELIGNPVIPDIKVELTQQDIIENRDEIFDKALKIIRE